MNPKVTYSQSFIINGGDFINAGSVSVKIKRLLKEIGLKPEIVYRTAICCYEAEMNVIMYAKKAVLDFQITPEEIQVTLKDEGQGIKDIQMALREGFSTATDKMREMGFGAGMGLPNIKKNSDVFVVSSEVNKGTEIIFKINLYGRN
jgi:anti-sigma regulatory factor (Ser/Thr protein kinase)